MLRRLLLVAGMAAVLVAVAAGPAVADPWGTVDCQQTPYAGCELGAGTGGGQGTVHHGGGVPSRGAHRGGGSGKSGGSAKPEKNADPDLNLADCSYKRSDYSPPPGVVQTGYGGSLPGRHLEPAVLTASARPAVAEPVDGADGPKPGDKGAWYVYKCTQDGVLDGVYRPPVWIADAPAGKGAAPKPSPAQLAQAAYRQLRLPSPAIEENPAREQLVGLPTWLWLGRQQWKPVSATASVPGVSVTATARPTSVVWDLGDGSSVTCAGPGTPYTAAGGPKRSSSCGHTYRVSSAGRPGGAFAVSATVRWSVTWAGAGQAGVFPGLTTVSDAQFRVAESEALNGGG